MSYIKLNNGVAEQYSFTQLRQDNPKVSFPKAPSNEVLADYDVYPYETDPIPEDAPVVEGSFFYELDGQWRKGFNTRAITDEERREDMIVSPRQARLALNAAGLLVSVDAAIAAMDEPEKTIVSLEWEYATEIQRLSSWVISMGVALGLGEDELDNLFVVAKDL